MFKPLLVATESYRITGSYNKSLLIVLTDLIPRSSENAYGAGVAQCPHCRTLPAYDFSNLEIHYCQSIHALIGL